MFAWLCIHVPCMFVLHIQTPGCHIAPTPSLSNGHVHNQSSHVYGERCPSKTRSLLMLTACLKGFNNCPPIYKLQVILVNWSLRRSSWMVIQGIYLSTHCKAEARKCDTHTNGLIGNNCSLAWISGRWYFIAFFVNCSCARNLAGVHVTSQSNNTRSNHWSLSGLHFW